MIQRQGDERVVVQLPGVQDTVRAKEILGATATLEFRLVHGSFAEWSAAQANGKAPFGNPALLPGRRLAGTIETQCHPSPAIRLSALPQASISKVARRTSLSR